MKPNPRTILYALLAMTLALAALYFVSVRSSDADSQGKPELYLMSSLPLKWGEGEIGELAQGKSEPSFFHQALVERYAVRDIDTLEQVRGKKGAVLLLVQPRLLAPSENVALDKWVRDGGRLILIADPALQWESRYPPGDIRRPLFTSLLSPILNHWGVQLALPTKDEAGPVEIGGGQVETLSRGFWLQHPHVERVPDCHSDRTAFIAECRIGKGRALMIADADILQDRFMGSGLFGESGNRAFVLDLIGRVATNRKIEGIVWENLGS